MLHFYIEIYIEENYGRNIDPGNNILQKIMYGIRSMLDYLNPITYINTAFILV